MSDRTPDANCIGIAAATLARPIMGGRPTRERMAAAVADAHTLVELAGDLLDDAPAPRVDEVKLERDGEGRVTGITRDGHTTPVFRSAEEAARPAGVFDPARVTPTRVAPGADVLIEGLGGDAVAIVVNGPETLEPEAAEYLHRVIDLATKGGALRVYDTNRGELREDLPRCRGMVVVTDEAAARNMVRDIDPAFIEHVAKDLEDLFPDLAEATRHTFAKLREDAPEPEAPRVDPAGTALAQVRGHLSDLLEGGWYDGTVDCYVKPVDPRTPLETKLKAAVAVLDAFGVGHPHDAPATGDEFAQAVATVLPYIEPVPVETHGADAINRDIMAALEVLGRGAPAHGVDLAWKDRAQALERELEQRKADLAASESDVRALMEQRDTNGRTAAAYMRDVHALEALIAHGRNVLERYGRTGDDLAGGIEVLGVQRNRWHRHAVTLAEVVKVARDNIADDPEALDHELRKALNPGKVSGAMFEALKAVEHDATLEPDALALDHEQARENLEELANVQAEHVATSARLGVVLDGARKLRAMMQPSSIADLPAVHEVIDAMLEDAEADVPGPSALDNALIERDLVIAGVRKVRDEWHEIRGTVAGQYTVSIDDVLARLEQVLERIPGEPSPIAVTRDAVIENAATGELMRIAPGAELPRGTWLMAAPIGDRSNMAERAVDRLVDALRMVNEGMQGVTETIVPTGRDIERAIDGVRDLIGEPDPVGRILGGLYVNDPKAMRWDKPAPMVTPDAITAKLADAIAEQTVAMFPDRKVLERILKRLDHARSKWPTAEGGFDEPLREGILTGETLEVVQAAREHLAACTDEAVAEDDELRLHTHARLTDELLDVSAVALRWLLALEPIDWTLGVAMSDAVAGEALDVLVGGEGR